MEIVITILCCWLALKALPLAFKVTWGVTKLVAWLLFGVAVPMLFWCLSIAGGLLILVPLALIGLAFGLLKFAL
jgi:hypothetical protein